MSNNTNPVIYRIHKNKRWMYSWYCEWNDYWYLLRTNNHIKDIIMSYYNDSNIIVVIDNISMYNVIRLYYNKPGIVIGKNGNNIRYIKNIINNRHPSKCCYIIVKQSFSLDCKCIMEKVVQGIDCNNYRRVITILINKVKQSCIRGIIICMAGRLNSSDIAKKEIYKYGRIARNRIDSKIDYYSYGRTTKYGIIGVKIWINY